MTIDDFKQTTEILLDSYLKLFREIEDISFIKPTRGAFKEVQQNILSQQSIAMLYAAWEGFFQNLLAEYISFLNQEMISVKVELFDLLDSIVVRHLEDQVSQLVNSPQKIAQKIRFYQKFETTVTANPIRLNTIINTNSNLGFKVMNDRLILFGIEKFSKVHKGLSGARHFLERDLKSLLDSRNRIAHGMEVLTASKIDQKDYNDYKLLLGDLMAEIIERMLVALNNKTYLKS